MTSYRELLAKGGDKALNDYRKKSIKLAKKIQREFDAVAATFSDWCVVTNGTYHTLPQNV